LLLWFLGITTIVFWGSFLFEESWAVEQEVESAEKEARAAKDVVKEHIKIIPPGEERKTDFVIMPIPMSNPTIGVGLGAAAMFLYPVDKKSPVSSTTAGAFYTNNDSWGAGVRQTTFLAEDQFRLNGLFGYGNINLDFYGLGTDAGNRGVSVPITEKGFFFMPDVLTRIAGRLYGGVRYRFIQMESDFDLNKLLNNNINFEPPTIKVRSSGAGLVMNYDSRDNPYNAYKGIFLDLNAIFAAKALGGDTDYQIYQAAYNYYHTLAEHMILAYRAFGKFTAGDVPFYDLSFFGVHNDLRGYPAGRYVDKMMFATQLEYRWRFWKRWGMVAFAGVGEVARNLSDFNTQDLLPSAGAGLRFMVSEVHRVNISVDYAQGKDGGAVYFYIGESF
jgi:outer membrane protein assembly factor BamA